LIATRAEELPVIKDAEAIQYVAKNVEVRGFVVSVTTSPRGTSFVNFGRDYPNQTFAGFIAAGSKIATHQQIAALQGKIIGITGKIECRPEPRWHFLTAQVPSHDRVASGLCRVFACRNVPCSHPASHLWRFMLMSRLRRR